MFCVKLFLSTSQNNICLKSVHAPHTHTHTHLQIRASKIHWK